ncbi:BolA Stress-induced morphogen (activity unknown) [Burkholderiaceae bacterium]|jgi:BolA protein
MNITADQLHDRLSTQLQPFALQVLDESADHAGHAGSDGSGQGTHFRVRIGAGVFQGLSRVAKHRLVYDALQQFTDQGMHALAIEIVDTTD